MGYDYNYGRPYRQQELGVCPKPRYDTPNCLDCEHFQIGKAPNRRCVNFPGQHIWAPACSPELERLENGEVLAEKCLGFQWASEFQKEKGAGEET